MNKKTIIIIVCLLVLAAVGGYFLYDSDLILKQKQDKSVELTKLTDKVAIAPILSDNKDALWFGEASSKIYRLNLKTKDTVEYPMPAVLVNFQDIIWSRNSSDFIAVAEDEHGEIRVYYNSAANSYTRLAANVRDLDWLADGRRIALIWKATDGKSQQLVTSDADGAGYKVLAQLPWDDFDVKVSPKGDQALLVRQNPVDQNNKVYLFDLENGQYQTVVDDGRNLEAAWLTADKFIFTRAEGTLYPQAYVHDLAAKKTETLNLAATLRRTAYDPQSNELIAVVVKPDGSDQFVKINLSQPAFKTTYFAGQAGVQARALYLYNGYLYFTDQKDGRLYSLN